MIVATLSRTLRNATLLLFVTATWLAVAQSQQDRKIDIGECRLHIVESGTGAPAVVFESGLGEDVATWADVQPKVASISRTVAYDRAGIGQSDPAKRPRTLVVMAGDLHSLLHAAKIPPPYILVGHSLGGTLVQVFAHSYPTEVAGLVLVDPEDRGLPDRLRSRMTAEEWTARQKALDEAMPKMPAGRAGRNENHDGQQQNPGRRLPIARCARYLAYWHQEESRIPRQSAGARPEIGTPQ
jgi:pimeloyl-ACP methyl ester carboxylesterase